MKAMPRNLEFTIPGFDSFALVSETHPDYERIMREKAEQEAAQVALESRQTLIALPDFNFGGAR